MGDTIAHQLSRYLTDLAVEHQCTVIVFEHLRSYRPRGEGRTSKARRANRRRSFWLRGKVQDFTGDKALPVGVLTVVRNPAYTSKCCPHCSFLNERFSTGKNPAHKSWYRCGRCDWEGDADVVAALNLHQKWLGTFRYPTAAEKQEFKQRVAERDKTPGQPGAAGPANPPCKPVGWGQSTADLYGTGALVDA